MRNGELKRAMHGVSQKMLTQTLRSLERDGLIFRRDYSEVPPRVEYGLTDLGKSLSEPIEEISAWGLHHFDQVITARQAYDRGESEASD